MRVADDISKPVAGAGGGLSQRRLKLGESVLDWIEVGRVALQVSQLGIGLLDGGTMRKRTQGNRVEIKQTLGRMFRLPAAERGPAATRQGPTPLSAATLHHQTPKMGAERARLHVRCHEQAQPVAHGLGMDFRLQLVPRRGGRSGGQRDGGGAESSQETRPMMRCQASAPG